MKSNDSPENPDKGETSDIPGLPSGESSNGRHVCYFDVNPASAELSLCMFSSPGWVFPHTAPKKLGMVGKTLFNYNFEE